MLTIFTTPKPFHRHITVIQANAIQSWTLLRPECEIILFGDEEGTAEVAAKFGIRHVPEVDRNEYGTPLVSSIFRTAQQIASNPLISYINADIILLSDFIPAIRQIHMPLFLLAGQRWNLDLTEAIDFTNPVWEEELRARLADKGKLNPQWGMDYFVFPRNMYAEMPAFAIGRFFWDTWMIYRARSMKLPVIDATKAITPIHQNHGYEHLPQGFEELCKGPERDRNLELAGGLGHVYSLYDATRILTPEGLKRPKPTIGGLAARVDRVAASHPPLHSAVKCMWGALWLGKAAYRRLRKLSGAKPSQWQA